MTEFLGIEGNLFETYEGKGPLKFIREGIVIPKGMCGNKLVYDPRDMPDESLPAYYECDED